MITEYKKCTFDDILMDAKTSEEKKGWLKAFASKEVMDRNGNMVKPSYLQIKNAYCKEFYPAIVPVAKPKSKSIYQKIEEL